MSTTDVPVTATSLLLFADQDDTTLDPARQVLQSQQAWDVAIRQSGETVQYNKTIETLRQEVAALREKADLGLVTSVEDVGSGLIGAIRARRKWKDNRAKPGAWAQSWLVRFSEFLASYSGIVEVVKAADSQYGGLAYGTLSVLLTIPLNKNQREEIIEDALEELALALPRLQSLEGIYPEGSANLKTLVATIYAEIILFARESVTYYQQSSLARLKKATFSPPKTGIKKKVTIIRQRLSEIRYEAEILMHGRLAEMETNSQTLLAQVKVLQKQLNEKQTNEDENNLSLLKSILNANEDSDHTNIANYEKLLDSVFADYVSIEEESCLMTWQRFASEPTIYDWLNSPGSSTAVLAGHNAESVTNTTLSWLSYGSIQIVAHFQQEGTIVAYYFCQTTPLSLNKQRVSIQEIGASLLYQISRQAPDVLRSGIEAIRREVESASWGDNDEEAALEAIGRGFLGVLSTLGSRTVVLVLDRLDRCQVDGTNVDDWEVPTLMSWLLSITNQATCVLKSLVILRPGAGSEQVMSRRERKRLSNREDATLYHEKLDWNQKTVH